MKSITSLILFTLILNGCATRPASIKAQPVDMSRFAQYSCDKLSVRIARLDDFIAQQYQTLKKDANLDAAQVAMAVVSPASLLFLDGTYGHKTAERGYARLKGKAIGLRRTAVKKQCPGAERYAHEAKLIEDNHYDFGLPTFNRPANINKPKQQEEASHD